MTLWGWMISRADFDEAIFDFNAYRKAGTMFPKIHTDKPCEPENAMGSPHLACIYDYASARFGIDAFDQPLGALQFGYFAFLESKGMIQIQNEHYRQIDAEIAQHIADLAAEKAAEKRKTEQCLH